MRCISKEDVVEYFEQTYPTQFQHYVKLASCMIASLSNHVVSNMVEHYGASSVDHLVTILAVNSTFYHMNKLGIE